MSEPLDLDKLRAKTDDTIKNYEDFPPVNDWELEAQRSALIVRALLQRVADQDKALRKLMASPDTYHTHDRDGTRIGCPLCEAQDLLDNTFDGQVRR